MPQSSASTSIPLSSIVIKSYTLLASVKNAPYTSQSWKQSFICSFRPYNKGPAFISNHHGRHFNTHGRHFNTHGRHFNTHGRQTSPGISPAPLQPFGNQIGVLPLFIFLSYRVLNLGRCYTSRLTLVESEAGEQSGVTGSFEFLSLSLSLSHISHTHTSCRLLFFFLVSSCPIGKNRSLGDYTGSERETSSDRLAKVVSGLRGFGQYG